jgi:hypothetical protein
MLQTGPKICDSTDGSCEYGCTRESGCSGKTFREKHALDYIQRMAEAVVADANRFGIVLTITTEPTQPLRMGGHEMVVETRRARELAPIIRGSWE